MAGSQKAKAMPPSVQPSTQLQKKGIIRNTRSTTRRLTPYTTTKILSLGYNCSLAFVFFSFFGCSTFCVLPYKF
ncbi:hypothetical protein COLO4_19290 [Corchorus olitorius]|uniref:Uncharacterized protein n=1 Tax=Corchorus olitorius TaxID=93759 RepID=A0A1R3J5Y0_9ROSI|nr:hypothetical protein COLO4_19290 [Corchorus olitorius]